MIKSMTGFGQAVLTSDDITISVEVKSLNSKFLDLNLRLPKIFSERELELRNAVAEKLERGKVSLSIDYIQTGKQEILQTYNEPLFLAYYHELKKLAEQVNLTVNENLFHTALNSPGVIQTGVKEELDPLLWEKASELVRQAIAKCDSFRSDEGKSLCEKLVMYVKSIESALINVEEIDPKRVAKIRSKIKGSVTAFFGEEGFDANRLEQEIIFYIEKLDIHEERVRLRTHLDYFLKILTESQSNGKKLGFIAQEIGREINTIGSKANDADMQKYVILMKEELEKIKEQLNNVL